MIKIENESAIVGNVKLTVLSSSNDDLKLEISRESNGSTFESAKDKAENIDYGFTNDSSSLYLNSFFSYPPDDLLRDQEVSETIVTGGQNCLSRSFVPSCDL
tara:strand:+ start:1313 stop:1618 length:306 start_codon:yes stop_codon:yes gene_type:complete